MDRHVKQLLSAVASLSNAGWIEKNSPVDVDFCKKAINTDSTDRTVFCTTE
jgi:hypothetical protein